ncbi:MAG: universal stress protein [Chloroflexi bacterium]|nr:universal stress protein [Chloroflexota bacterium]
MSKPSREKQNGAIERILVPLDDSALAAEVLPYVASIAERFRSKCLIYHVREPRPRWREGELPSQIGGPAVKSIEEYLDRVAQRLAGRGIEVDTLVESGEPAGMILRAARGHRADLLAIATHGHGGIGQWLFGSVAHRVVERANTTLLLVRPSASAPPVGPIVFRQILVPVYPCEEGEAPLPLATEFAARHGATLHLLHVNPTLESLPATRLTAASISPAMAGEFLAAATAAAQAYLQELAARLAEKHIAVEYDVRRGEPAEEILKYVRQMGIELTFMATHGRLGLGGAWSGSVVNKVLHRFTTPLVLVRAPGKHEED